MCIRDRLAHRVAQARLRGLEADLERVRDLVERQAVVVMEQEGAALRQRQLVEAVEQLPVAQRSAFLLHHDDGLGLDEVARALEVGFETAKTRLRYAMSKLRTCMGAYLEPIASPTRKGSAA